MAIPTAAARTMLPGSLSAGFSEVGSYEALRSGTVAARVVHVLCECRNDKTPLRGAAGLKFAAKQMINQSKQFRLHTIHIPLFYPSLSRTPI